MSRDEVAGVVFPASADGRRSTSAVGRAVVADALRSVDPAGARDAEHDANWRTGYLVHFRRLVEAGLASKDAAVSVARGGLESVHRHMRVVQEGGAETGLDGLLSAPAQRFVATVTVPGTGETQSELSLPYRGERLRGDALLRRLQTWADNGVIEPSCADAVRTVAAHPQWLRLPGRTVVALEAGAEVGPLPVLLSWGARVIAIDLPRPAIWERLLGTARRSGGTLLVPVAGGKPGQRQPGGSDQVIAQRAGLDLISDVPAVAGWLAAVDGPLVLGNYVYADGAPTCAWPPPSTRSPCACRPDVTMSHWRSSRRRPTCSPSRPRRSRSPSAPTQPGREQPNSPPARCGRCRAGACSARPTCPALTQHQRQPGAAARPQLCARKARAPLACHTRP